MCRWTNADGVMGQSYLPKSPLSALSAVAVLAGFGGDFMGNHAVGRATVTVPVAWIDAVVPGGRIVYQTVRTRNRTGAGKPDRSGQSAVESILYLVSQPTNPPPSVQYSSPVDKLLFVSPVMQAEAFWQSAPFLLRRYTSLLVLRKLSRAALGECPPVVSNN